jgi:hypothetical protein
MKTSTNEKKNWRNEDQNKNENQILWVTMQSKLQGKNKNCLRYCIQLKVVIVKLEKKVKKNWKISTDMLKVWLKRFWEKIKNLCMLRSKFLQMDEARDIISL